MPPSDSDAAPALRLQDVEAGYGDEPVLHGLDLTVPAGAIYALLGANGAGKSTAARAACGTVRLRRGRVSVGGRPVGQARVGLAPQECALFPSLTPRENGAVTARLCGLNDGQARRAAVDRALALAGCEARADQPVRTLSGGWRRRANLAAALVGRPALLIADEPTEGVDAATRVVLGRALRDAAGDGSGCLLISHDAGFVAQTADLIGILVAGRLVAEGTPDALLRDAFGAARLLSVRFDRSPGTATARALRRAGLAASDDGTAWTLLADDPLSRAQALSLVVDAEGGELAVRRPGVDDLVALVTEWQT